MNVAQTWVEGCLLLHPDRHEDVRGSLVKPFHAVDFEQLGLETRFKEMFYSTSTRRTLRGLHLQRPPHDLNKLVVCIAGNVLDAVVDLRAESATRGRHILLPLGPGDAIYVPKGCAHGFYVESDEAILLYATSELHDPAADTGVLWNSAGIGWPDDAPILSDRDRALPTFDEFGWVAP